MTPICTLSNSVLHLKVLKLLDCHMFTNVFTFTHVKNGDEQPAARKAVRRGTPFTVYFDLRQTEALNAVARDRHVSKATIIRLAVDQLLRQIEGGQLPLALGINAGEHH